MLHRQLRSPHARHLQGQHRHETARLAEPMVVAGGFWSVVPFALLRSDPIPPSCAAACGSGFQSMDGVWIGFQSMDLVRVFYMEEKGGIGTATRLWD